MNVSSSKKVDIDRVRLCRLRKKATCRRITVNDVVQGLKPVVYYQRLTAPFGYAQGRLKSCPDKKQKCKLNRKSSKSASAERR